MPITWCPILKAFSGAWPAAGAGCWVLWRDVIGCWVHCPAQAPAFLGHASTTRPRKNPPPPPRPHVATWCGFNNSQCGYSSCVSNLVNGFFCNGHHVRRTHLVHICVLEPLCCTTTSKLQWSKWTAARVLHRNSDHVTHKIQRAILVVRVHLKGRLASEM